jgi:serine/threonine protein kinase/tetratricopeptide (TPR) repeat protein
MVPDRWQKVEQLYRDSLAQPSAQRATFLAGACGSDQDLLREVQSLLAQDASPTAGLFGATAWDATAHIPARPVLQPGTQIGPYKLEALLGVGGMGQVFRAVDTRLLRTVAIKFLLGHDMADAAHRRRFLREAQAASALQHPHIVVIYDIAQVDGIDFLTMEHISGQTLKDATPADGLPIDTVAQLGSQIASALAAAHGAGIVHRDIKPANIMVTRDQHAKVLDFGLAKVVPGASRDGDANLTEVTTPGTVMGTINYMSPEQTRGETLDGSSDVFSLGCVLYQAATGRLPFRGPSTLAIMHEIATAAPDPPSRVRSGLPAAFDQLIAQCLEKNPRQRPSAGDVSRDLKRLDAPSDASARIVTDRPSLAVVPFLLRTSGPDDEFLSVALADAVIHRLASTGKLLVRPISSVLRYKAAETEWAQVARDLNVDLVVEGTIQKMGAKVRVLVQVHRAADAQTLHSSKHDGDADDLFGLQDRIADCVSEVFVPRQNSSAVPAAPPTKNPLAYELYLRALDRMAHFNKFDISSAIEMLSRAVEIDPGFADAWGCLAQAYSQMGMFFDPDPQWFELGESAVAKTLELDPVQCDAHHARGQILWSPSRGFQNRSALRAMNAAVRVNPSRYTARNFRGAILFHLGFHKEAERDVREALLLNPSFTLGLTSMGLICQYKGDFQAAHEFNERALAIDPTFMHANFWSPLVLLLLGRIEEGATRLERTRPMIPGEPQLAAVEGLIAALEGNFKRAEERADEATQASKKSVTHTHHTWHTAAGVYALCGKPEKAVFELRRCAKLGLPNHVAFINDPNLLPLRDYPDFVALLSELRRDYDQFRQEFDLSGEVLPARSALQ